MMSPSRERCWIVHKSRAYWQNCPQCGKPIRWVRLWDGQYCPCDDEPVLFSFEKSGKHTVVVKRDLIENVSLSTPENEKPRYGRLPHFYSCPVLIEERRAWAKKHRSFR